MNGLQALLMGLIQGLTEYLPVSSSGHLQIGKMLLGIDAKAGGLSFEIMVHVATVLATLVVLRSQVSWLVRGLFNTRWNEAKRYCLNILVSMIPVGIVGVFYKDRIEALYTDEHVRNMVLATCLLVTGVLLMLTHFAQENKSAARLTEEDADHTTGGIRPWQAFVIGIAQAVAVLPGLSRSGSTIATGLLLGNRKDSLAQFSFLMVIPPILGEALLDFKDIFSGQAGDAAQAIPLSSMAVGFLAAFVSGCIACRWMISLVRRAKLIWFGIYCCIAGAMVFLIG